MELRFGLGVRMVNTLMSSEGNAKLHVVHIFFTSSGMQRARAALLSECHVARFFSALHLHAVRSTCFSDSIDSSTVLST